MPITANMSDKGFTEYAQVLASRMGLSNWEIAVQQLQLADESLEGYNTISAERLSCVITIEVNKKRTAVELRRLLVHELLHCHFSFVDHALGTIEGLLGKPVETVLWANYHLAREKQVEQIARFWAPRLPLP